MYVVCVCMCVYREYRNDYVNGSKAGFSKGQEERKLLLYRTKRVEITSISYLQLTKHGTSKTTKS